MDYCTIDNTLFRCTVDILELQSNLSEADSPRSGHTPYSGQKSSHGLKSLYMYYIGNLREATTSKLRTVDKTLAPERSTIRYTESPLKADSHAHICVQLCCVGRFVTLDRDVQSCITSSSTSLLTDALSIFVHVVHV